MHRTRPPSPLRLSPALSCVELRCLPRFWPAILPISPPSRPRIDARTSGLSPFPRSVPPSRCPAALRRLLGPHPCNSAPSHSEGWGALSEPRFSPPHYTQPPMSMALALAAWPLSLSCAGHRSSQGGRSPSRLSVVGEMRGRRRAKGPRSADPFRPRGEPSKERRAVRNWCLRQTEAAVEKKVSAGQERSVQPNQLTADTRSPLRVVSRSHRSAASESVLSGLSSLNGPSDEQSAAAAASTAHAALGCVQLSGVWEFEHRDQGQLKRSQVDWTSHYGSTSGADVACWSVSVSVSEAEARGRMVDGMRMGMGAGRELLGRTAVCRGGEGEGQRPNDLLLSSCPDHPSPPTLHPPHPCHLRVTCACSAPAAPLVPHARRLLAHHITPRHPASTTERTPQPIARASPSPTRA